MTAEIEEEIIPNDQLVLVCGESGAGKSASLRNIRDQDDWLYLGTEAGKRLPFRHKFRGGGIRVSNPYEVQQAFNYACTEEGLDVKGIIVDSVTFMMEMYESQYVLTSPNTQQAWQHYQQFFKQLMQQDVIKFARPTVMTAHVLDVFDENSGTVKTSVPVKGALKNNGIEAYFSTVVMAKKVPLRELEKYGSDLLTITEEDKELGYKHVFQTRPTKATAGTRIRSPMGMFTREQTYMDNCVQKLLDHLHKFYNDEVTSNV